MGSPLTKKYKGHDGHRLYIIGIAFDEFEFEGRFYARFVKSTAIFKKVEDIVKRLECADTSKDGNNIGKAYKAIFFNLTSQ